MKMRSISANSASSFIEIWAMIEVSAVPIGIGSCSERNRTPAAVRSRTSTSTSVMLRPSRSRVDTVIESPGAARVSSAVSPSRSTSLPVFLSTKVAEGAMPAAARASSCRSSSCLRVLTRA
jgi:hypothetical protein